MRIKIVKILVVNTDYDIFLSWFYRKVPDLATKSYDEQMRIRNESLFGMADFYSANLRKLGHEAWDAYMNNEIMQETWMRERGVLVEQPAESGLIGLGAHRLGRLKDKAPWRFFKPILSKFVTKSRDSRSWLYNVLIEQIKEYRPDVLINLAMDGVTTSFLQEVKDRHRIFIMGLGEPPVLFNKQDWRIYDLVLAPSEGMVNYFRKTGLKTELLRFGFETRILSLLEEDCQKTFPVSFVGSVGDGHSWRSRLLEVLSGRLGNKLAIWAPAFEDLSSESALAKRYQGAAWGTDFYKILAASQMTLNCHIDIAGEYADNMRLFEATGVGALLITDWKKNLHEMFELGKEVVAYKTPEECTEIIQYYLGHDDEREAIAKAGQQRTLREHTYHHRMKELVEIIHRYL